jgi:hypothetical protein
LAEHAYDTDWLRGTAFGPDDWTNIPPKSNRKSPIYFSSCPLGLRNSTTLPNTSFKNSNIAEE